MDGRYCRSRKHGHFAWFRANEGSASVHRCFFAVSSLAIVWTQRRSHVCANSQSRVERRMEMEKRIPLPMAIAWIGAIVFCGLLAMAGCSGAMALRPAAVPIVPATIVRRDIGPNHPE